MDLPTFLGLLGTVFGLIGVVAFILRYEWGQTERPWIIIGATVALLLVIAAYFIVLAPSLSLFDRDTRAYLSHATGVANWLAIVSIWLSFIVWLIAVIDLYRRRLWPWLIPISFAGAIAFTFALFIYNPVPYFVAALVPLSLALRIKNRKEVPTDAGMLAENAKAL